MATPQLEKGYKQNYAELLRNPRWRERREEILFLDDYTCRDCFDTESTLHVHHIYYEKGHFPWEYPDNLLITLCYGCHEIEHERQKKLIGTRMFKELQLIGFRAKHHEWVVPFDLKLQAKQIIGTHETIKRLSDDFRQPQYDKLVYFNYNEKSFKIRNKQWESLRLFNSIPINGYLEQII